MIFFGLGEAFRSGTHKAMIYTYLDHNKWEKQKTFVYGRTRSFSMIGSAISSLLGILLILIVPNDSYIFLFSIIPYILDIILIISYPSFLDVSAKKNYTSIKQMIKKIIDNSKINKRFKYLIIEESIDEASYSYSKDLIQPILEIIIIDSRITIISSISSDDNLKISLELVYAVFNLCGLYFSKRTYIIKRNKTSISCLYYIHIFNAITFLFISLLCDRYILVYLLYI